MQPRALGMRVHNSFYAFYQPLHFYRDISMNSARDRERKRETEREKGGRDNSTFQRWCAYSAASQNLYARYARRENSIINVEKTNIASRARRSTLQMLNCVALAIWFFSLFPRRSFKQLIPSLAKFLRSDERASKSYAVVMRNCCKTEFAVYDSLDKATKARSK